MSLPHRCAAANAHQLRSALASALAHSGSASGAAASPPRSSGDASTATPTPLPLLPRRGAGALFQDADFHVGVSAGLSSTSKRTLLRGRGTPAAVAAGRLSS